MSLLGDSNTSQTNIADLRRSLTEKYPSLNSENNINKKSNTKISDENQNLSAKSLLKVNSAQPNGTRLKDFGGKFGQALLNNWLRFYLRSNHLKKNYENDFIFPNDSLFLKIMDATCKFVYLMTDKIHRNF